MEVLVVGAGFSGAVVARELAEAGHRVTVVERRAHVAGNCHTERDAATGVMVHVYGPHIFHTGDDEVWDYASRFGAFRRYKHRVLTTVGARVFSLPINLLTINQFFGETFSPEEARAFLEREADTSIADPQSFEEQALRFVGPRLYEAFFEGYTRKQWGCAPSDLPASILKRLPLRFSYDDSYFAHPHQGVPEDGYTAIVERILDHPAIDVHLETIFDPAAPRRAEHVFYSGPLDGWFDERLGRLGYRTLDFQRFEAEGDWQGCPVMNYGDAATPWTRITEHKHFAPWERHDRSVLYREFSREAGVEDIPYYPIRLVEEKSLLADYVALAEAEAGVTFMGRLGTYRYLDMDVTIREALDAARGFLADMTARRQPQRFSQPPL